ncbi:hypothetical protein BDR05DRAFT_1042662 [Suillus weaverae]|nr:hypothetical protein BDR05DRAFT_1042662 [Suillus weaverae]
MSLQPFISLYRYALEPIAPFSWFGIKVCPIELVAALRFCTILRHIREDLYAKYQRRAGITLHLDLCTSLTIEFGGEAMIGTLLLRTCPLLGVSPCVYIAAQAIVEHIPVLPSMSLGTELPLFIVDRFTRALLLCSLTPKPVITHASPDIASSPWTLLLSSRMPSLPKRVIANGGVFIMGMVTFLKPTPLTLHIFQPVERLIKPYGWTTMDLCSILGRLHSIISTVLGNTGDKVIPMNPEAAHALCALILTGMSSIQAVKNHGLGWKRSATEKI